MTAPKVGDGELPYRPTGAEGVLPDEKGRGTILVQEIVHRYQELMQDAVCTDSAYQADVLEGWDLAKQAKK